LTFQEFFDDVTAKSIQDYKAGPVVTHLVYRQRDGNIRTTPLAGSKNRMRAATMLSMTMVQWEYFLFVEEMHANRIILLDKPRITGEASTEGGCRLLLIQGISGEGDFRSITFDGEQIREKEAVAGTFSLESALLEINEKAREAL
jgi:hypothetical protein